jgi:hypothetical protein
MKRYFSVFLCFVLMFSFLSVEANAAEDNVFTPYVVDFSLTTETDEDTSEGNNARASLIHSYSLYLTKTGTTLNITGQTYGSGDVVKAGFKDLTIQRRKTSDDDWEDYYEYGNVYIEATFANLSTTLVVEAGYQYRISCKHYAKKNLLSVQTIANTSNIVTAKAT